MPVVLWGIEIPWEGLKRSLGEYQRLAQGGPPSSPSPTLASLSPPPLSPTSISHDLSRQMVKGNLCDKLP